MKPIIPMKIILIIVNNSILFSKYLEIMENYFDYKESGAIKTKLPQVIL